MEVVLGLVVNTSEVEERVSVKNSGLLVIMAVPLRLLDGYVF